MERYLKLFLVLIVMSFVGGCNVPTPEVAGTSSSDVDANTSLFISKSDSDPDMYTTSEVITIGESIEVYSMEDSSGAPKGTSVSWVLTGDIGNLTVLSGGKKARFIANKIGVGSIEAQKFGKQISLSIEVAGNPVPVAIPEVVDVLNSGAAVDINLISNDTDANGDDLTIHSIDAAVNGSITNNGDGTVKYTPAVGYFGKEVINYSITDGFNSPVSTSLTINSMGNFSWTGRGGDLNWSNQSNWCGSISDGQCQGDQSITPDDVASFSSVCSDCDVSINEAINIDGISISSDYDATISQNSNVIQIGNSGFIQSGGTFLGSSSNITIDGDLRLLGGSFTSSSGVLRLSQGPSILYNRSPAVFIHNSGTISIDPNESAGCETLAMDIDSDVELVLNELSVRVRDTSGCNGSEQGRLRNLGSAPVVVEADLNVISGALHSGTYHLKSNASFGYTSWSTKSGIGTSRLIFNGLKNQEYDIQASAKAPIFEINNPGFSVSPKSGMGNMTLNSVFLVDGIFNTVASTNIYLRNYYYSSVNIVQTGGTLDLSSNNVFVYGTATCGNVNSYLSSSSGELVLNSLDVISSDIGCNGNLNAVLNIGPSGVRTKGNLNLVDGYLKSGIISVEGDISLSCASPGGSNCFHGGTTSIELDGTGAQAISMASGSALPTGEFLVDKASGDLQLNSNIAFSGSGSGHNLNLKSSTINLNNFNLEDIDGFSQTSGTTITKGTGLFKYEICSAGPCIASD
ncbi:MAG: cadherin-like domain-containing protein [Bdellovibrionales bacterium]